jgi:hypothetical protein
VRQTDNEVHTWTMLPGGRSGVESPYLPHPLCLGGNELAGYHDLCRGRLVRGESEAFGRAMGHVVFVIVLGGVRVGSRGLILRRGGVKVIIVERRREDCDCHCGRLRGLLVLSLIRQSKCASHGEVPRPGHLIFLGAEISIAPTSLSPSPTPCRFYTRTSRGG